MKILITGASGFVGSYLTNYFASIENYDVTVLVRKEPSFFNRFKNKIKIIECDILEFNQMKFFLIEKFDSIIHLAAYNDVDTTENPEKALLVNAFGTKNILNIAKELNVDNFIYFSVLQVYGRELEGDYTSDSAVFCDNDYSLNHFVAEEYCKMYSKNYGIKTSVLRLAYAFGCPFDLEVDRWTIVPEAFCISAFNEHKIVIKSSGKVARDFVPLSYVAQSVENLITKPKPGNTIYNLTSEVVISILETAEVVKIAAKEILDIDVKIILETKDPIIGNKYLVKNNILGPLNKESVIEIMKNEMKQIFVKLKNRRND
jgi:UDP-glucose 4-epimerase